jgi:hypothetical protein
MTASVFFVAMACVGLGLIALGILLTSGGRVETPHLPEISTKDALDKLLEKSRRELEWQARRGRG